ncbi:uncharacterized protein MEPE_03289 [Melanopsichium pennsylvanicum]|uniref:Uncharacterized protein n=2 Tax=Melanopsichium pennsylvanicum TaxID=63383 RepID=A0AAJ4XLV4_9BASI|nr:uncharacterized protein BN887_05125 [Melanopsichium pennsylvanicum 4]SNX84580.1 uncharacterized protein MEPE_03289 [Melanopsichium pennsylvanicum]
MSSYYENVGRHLPSPLSWLNPAAVGVHFDLADLSSETSKSGLSVDRTTATFPQLGGYVTALKDGSRRRPSVSPLVSLVRGDLQALGVFEQGCVTTWQAEVSWAHVAFLILQFCVRAVKEILALHRRFQHYCLSRSNNLAVITPLANAADGYYDQV